MNLIKSLRKVKLNKKGFTLVELIVVLVILAILLAILVPSLIGWINRARDRQVLISARNVYLAGQTVIAEHYGVNNGYPTLSDASFRGNVDTLAKVGVLGSDYAFDITAIDGDGNITAMSYQDLGRGRNVAMTAGVWGEVGP